MILSSYWTIAPSSTFLLTHLDLANRPLSRLTFFAANNDALPDHHHDDGDHHSPASRAHAALAHILRTGDGDDKDDKRHKVIQRIIHSLIQYHTLIYPASFNDLAANSTVWTSLTGSPFKGDQSFDGQWRRLRVETKGLQPLTTIQLNWVVNIVEHDIKAANGEYYIWGRLRVGSLTTSFF
jgi:hypothetical protein